MDIKLMKAWAKALRSGKYKQGKGRLCRKGTPNTFCCLGVLCDVVNPDGWKNEHDGYDHLTFLGGERAFGFSANLLPTKIRNTIGITYAEEDKLIALNDEKGSKQATFEEIADVIDLLRMDYEDSLKEK